ncbi:trace amine-associated receptor 13c-like [Patiria miniata]|uniref:G-protein coupled receptors family 1 profile domain-containing protein n=1 Tax=Patiria miniata TaxID=46514 RepID=A0A914A403_PATMI|nr:trace amine-associated receptor 13c-like [Patiria miniata]
MSGNSTSLDAFPFTICADIICGLKVATIFSISTLTTAGNLVALITIGSTPSLRNCHGLLLMSLSLADLFTGLIACSSIYPSVYNLWPFGDTMCLVVAGVEAVAKKASLLTLTLLSIERYIAVVYPLRYTRIITKQKIVTGVVFCWILSILFLTTLFMTRQIVQQYALVLHSCTVTYQNQLLSIALTVGLFILPSLATVSVTSALAWVGMKKHTRVRSHMISKLTEQGGQTRKAIKFFRMCRIMAFTFYACWAPITIVGFACVLAGVRQPLGVFFALYWLQFSNSFWNVVIYFAMNDAFRRRARELFLSPFVALRRLC